MYDTKPPEETEEKQKEDLLFKFMILRRQYQNVEIPEFTEHSDLQMMKRIYEKVIKQVSLDSSVENYRQYLVGGFLVTEFLSVNLLNINLSGFFQSQLTKINTYDRLLLELGEKNYTIGSRFPVEVRLLGLILFNAGIFYVQKNIGGSTAEGGMGGIASLLNMFTGMGKNTQTQQAPQKRKMRGPTISPEDVENMAKGSSGITSKSSDNSE
jgi:hypothetical protein